MKKVLLILTVFALILAFTSCNKPKETKPETPPDTYDIPDSTLSEESLNENEKKFTLEIEDGDKLEFITPKDWVIFKESKNMNPNLAFMITNNKGFISMVIEQSKAFPSFKDFEKAAVESLSSQLNLDIQIEEITINNVTGSVTPEFDAVINEGDQKLELKYVIYLIKSDQNYLQILTWTAKDDFEESGKTLSDIISTLKLVE